MSEFCQPGAHDLQSVMTATASAVPAVPTSYCTKCGLCFGGSMSCATVAANGFAAIAFPLTLGTGDTA